MFLILKNLFITLLQKVKAYFFNIRIEDNKNYNIDDLASYCLKKWGHDEKTADLKSKIEKWISQVDEEEKKILIKLFQHFDYYTRSNINSIFIDIYKKKISKLRDIDYTIYTPIKSQNHKVNSSYELLIDFRNLNELNHNSIIDDLKPLSSKSMWENIMNIVLIDDISGTGKTITDFLDENYEMLKTKNITIFVLVITKLANEAINQYKKDKKLNLDLLYSKRIQKAFDDSYIFDKQESNSVREIIRGRELIIWNNNKKYVLGKGETEALTAFIHNTPNNTLSCFWYSENSWYAPFPRRKDKLPKWSKPLSERRNDSKKINYQIRKNMS